MGVFSLIAVLCGAYLIWYYIWMPRENMGTAEEYEEYKIESNEETPEAAEPVEIPIVLLRSRRRIRKCVHG